MEDKLVIGGHEFESRFILGSGKYSLDLINAAVKNAGAQIITLALRRAQANVENILDYIPKGVTLLPNTSGARDADEAVRIARLARECGCGDFVKIEIMRDSKYLLPDNQATTIYSYIDVETTYDADNKPSTATPHIYLNEIVGYTLTGVAQWNYDVAVELDGTYAVIRQESSTVTVDIRAINEIRMLQLPTKTTYNVGETFDPTGLTIKMIYSDGSEVAITEGFEISGFDSSTAMDDQIITVTYRGFMTTFTVDIVEPTGAPVPSPLSVQQVSEMADMESAKNVIAIIGHMLGGRA